LLKLSLYFEFVAFGMTFQSLSNFVITINNFAIHMNLCAIPSNNFVIHMNPYAIPPNNFVTPKKQKFSTCIMSKVL
jgi:hypothetical protein